MPCCAFNVESYSLLAYAFGLTPLFIKHSIRCDEQDIQEAHSSAINEVTFYVVSKPLLLT